MDTFGNIYLVVWSIGAICFSVVLLFFRKWFLKSNKNAYLYIAKKTKLSFFEERAQEFDKPYMDILIMFLGIVFLIVGILELLGYSI